MKGGTKVPRGPRRDRLINERIHDPYKGRRKLPEKTTCPQCGAVVQNGRWQWVPRPTEVREELCQACQRTNDQYPAGLVTLSGDFIGAHRSEILNLARNQEELEKGAHPLHRIMAFDEGADGILIKTTDIHLPRRIGEALHQAYGGTLDFHYEKESYFIRVNWKRDG